MIVSSHGIIGSSIGQVDADALAFFARVTAAGGTLSTTEKTAVNTLVVQMKFDGIWNSMKAIYPMVGASDAACKQNLKSSSFTGSFSSGWSFASTGVMGNGFSAFMDTGLKSSNLGQNSTHLSIYSRTDAGGNMIDMGMYSDSNSTYLAYKFSGLIYPTIQSTESQGGASPYTTTLGLIVGNRNNSTETKFYQNSSLLGTFARTSTTPNNAHNLYLGCYNNAGTANNFSLRQYALASLGDGLTDPQASNFYNAVQAFQTTLGRAV